MLYQFLIILTLNYIGVILSETLHLQIPGTVTGLILFFIALNLKIVKLNSVKDVGEFLISNMLVTFIPPSIKLLEVINFIKSDFFKLIFLLIVTTLITMAVTSLTVDFLIKRRK